MTNWPRKTVLVTGGCGHIGSRLIELLLQRNVNYVRIVDNPSAYEFSQQEVFCRDILKHDNVQLILGNITDYELIRGAIKDVDMVFHLAAYADVGACIRNPDENFRSNILGVYNLLKRSLEEGVQKYVFASSAAVYGDQPHWAPNEPPKFREDMRPNPLSNYGNAKLWGENEAKLFYELYGLKTVSLRYFSIYGPFQIPKRGSHSWVTAIFAMRAYKGKTLEIYGDGEQVRDFIYVYDAAEVTIRAAEASGVAGEVVNIGTGRPTKIKDLALMIRDLAKEYFGKDEVEMPFKPRPKGDPLGGYAGTTKMKNLLRWEPKVSLEEGLRKYFEWILENSHLVPKYI